MQFQIDTASNRPIYRQLADQIREATARGDLQAEERLPSVRELSRELVVNPNTVARAYTELEREGLLNSRPGLGVFIARPRAELTKQVRRKRLLEMLDGLLTEAVHLGFSADEVLQMARERVEQYQWNAASSSPGQQTTND